MDHVAEIDKDVLGKPRDAKKELQGNPKKDYANSKLNLLTMKA